MTRADLTGASLHKTDLTAANLSSANFNRASFLKADLTEACLNKAQLVETDLIQTNLARANLTEANLTGANLTGANLVQAQAWMTNLDGSTLTGACLENIQLNNHTSLENVTCKYLYLKYYQKQRQPEDCSQSLSENEFQFIIQDLIGSVNLIFTPSVDWEIFLQKLHRLQSKYKDREIKLKSIEVLPNGNYLVKIDSIPGITFDTIHN